MTSESTITPQVAALIEAVGNTGIGVWGGGANYDRVTTMMVGPLLPAVVLDDESDIPSNEEIADIVSIGREKLEQGGFRSDGELAGAGFNTIRLKKLPDGSWTFRRMTWRVGPTWYPLPGTLQNLRERI